jgi:hypothetical protein
VIFGYVLFIWRRQAALEAELCAIEARMRSLSEGTGAAKSEARSGS